MLRPLLITLILAFPLIAGQQDNRKVEGSTQGIEWGKHWAGPKLKTPAELKGKVTLLVLWGGWIGCQQLTPGMVGLAKELQGKPFQLIASYCQRGNKDNALAALKRHGWSKKMTNTTVMYQTDFPKAPVTYVPYYLIFDHNGKLRHNHMAGPYHGGNRDTYKKQVKALLKKVPQ